MNWGVGVLVLGILVILGAAGMPATTVEETTSCYYDAWGYENCSTIQYEAPNIGKSVTGGFGVMLLISGIVVTAIGGGSSETVESPEHSLAEELRKRQ